MAGMPNCAQARGEFLGHGGAFEEAEGGASVKFVLEFEAVFIADAGRDGFERAIGGAAGELLQIGCRGPEPLHDAVAGQHTEIFERADTPAVKRLVRFGIDGQRLDAELADVFRFGAARDDGDARQVARREDGRIGILRNTDVAGETALGSAARDFAGDLVRRSDQLAQRGHRQHDGIGRGDFHQGENYFATSARRMPAAWRLGCESPRTVAPGNCTPRRSQIRT